MKIFGNLWNFTPDNCVSCEVAFVEHTRFLARHCSMSGANIQAWVLINDQPVMQYRHAVLFREATKMLSYLTNKKRKVCATKQI